MANGCDRWLEVQYHQASGFVTALFEAIARADDYNLARLVLAYPQEVRAYVLWRSGRLREFFDSCTPGPLLDRARAEYDVEQTQKGA